MCLTGENNKNVSQSITTPLYQKAMTLTLQEESCDTHITGFGVFGTGRPEFCPSPKSLPQPHKPTSKEALQGMGLSSSDEEEIILT
jgi:hypothetical protein